MVQPRWEGSDAPEYFTEAEYEGGYDEVTLIPPEGVVGIEATLYYQTTSKEYIEFLRDEVNGDNPTLPPEAYIAQTDPFFQELRGWGDAIWDLWLHNDGAEPVEMTSVSIEFEAETPEPEPQPELEPEPEVDQNTGIPGYSIEAVMLGTVLFVLVWAQSRRHSLVR